MIIFANHYMSAFYIPSTILTLENQKSEKKYSLRTLESRQKNDKTNVK